MTIVLTGGGSGGHITPLMAVAAELKRQRPEIKLVYIGQKGDGLGDIPTNNPAIDETYTIRAGKLRRYHGEGLKQLLDLPTTFKNLRDLFYILIGIIQSWRLLRRLKPNVVFIKGGFVGTPVGLAAAQQGIPYITHDSDAVPGLANRLIARWATKHAVALPAELYNYPADKTVTTGIPLQDGFEPLSEKLRQQYRRELDLPAKAKVIFVIGGGLGSQRINRALGEALPHLLAEHHDLWVNLSVGRNNVDEMSTFYDQKLGTNERQRLQVHGYIDDVYRYSGAADIIITRAGATNLAEFALQGTACIVIPSPFLTGGHQLKNAQYLAGQGAIQVIDETELVAEPNRIAKVINHLFQDHDKVSKLEKNFAKFAYPDATKELTRLILEQL